MCLHQMFAIVKEGNKQYLVREGNVIYVEKMDAEVGSKVSLNNVLSVNGQLIGQDVKSASVKAEVLDQKKDDKVIVFKKKRRQGYRRKRGHRQQLTVLRIAEISAK